MGDDGRQWQTPAGPAAPTDVPVPSAPPAPPAPSAPPAISLLDVRKSFGTNPAVAGLSLTIPRGSFFGLVGPNGAGKTTTLSMISGLLRPDSGTILVDGHDVWADPQAAKRRLGVLPEGLRLFERLTGRELLGYLGLLRGLPAPVVEQRSDELLAVLGLTEAAGTLVVDYSTGMRKKVALAAALLHAPPILLLDEPFEGVDPVSGRVIREVLARHTATGGTIVFSSHVMELVERLCDSVGIVARGRLLAAGQLDWVRRGRSLEEVFVSLVGTGRSTQGALGWLGSSSG